MNLRKILGGGLAALALFATLAAPSRAQQQFTFASIVALNPNQGFAYDPATGFSVTTTIPFRASETRLGGQVVNANVTFTGMANIGNANNVADGIWAQPLTGGTFLITQMGTGTVLLSGTFGEAQLTGNITTPPSTQGNVRTVFEDVNYTGGTFFTSSGLFNPGGFSIALTAITPPLALVASPTPGGSGLRFRAFTSSGSGTFSATPVVPEPGLVAFMATSGLSLVGMMGRARLRRRSGGSLTA